MGEAPVEAINRNKETSKMDTKLIMTFLRNIAAHNDRPWFQEHKNEYQAALASYEQGIGEAIKAISHFDPSIAYLTPKDCMYRFYRDIRFSPDKSPYKRHFGAYISAKGKKSLHGGYYIHMEPGKCFLGGGVYWLPTNILTACRNEIMANEKDWLKIVTSGEFVHNFGYPNEGTWEEDKVSDKGFGMTALKTAPKGFPRDYKYLDYLRMKDYSCWHAVPDDFFEGNEWTKEAARIFKVMKPMMDFVNAVVDDYE